MSKDTLLIRTDHGDGIVEISLNRAPVNALSADSLMALADMMTALAGDETVRAVVLSSPFKVFSAGLDLKEAQGFDLADQHAIVTGLNVGFPALFSFPKPTVAAVKGAAIAGGFFYVLACDFRIAGPRARFGLAEVRVGADFPPGPMEIARATLGPNALRRLMLTGQPINATEAAAMSVVDVIEPDEAAVLDRALRVARDLAASPPEAYARIKRQIHEDAVARIDTAIAAGANTPEGGWFTAGTKAAMQRMIDSR
jgi:enoyl-CoA hydratase/carnithine racemase